jgi:FAD/FMN-containing dehydrogenase
MAAMTSVAPAVIDRLKDAAGPGGWSQDPERLAPKLVEWRGRWQGATPLLLLPDSTECVAALVRICAETATPLIPQGGNTGLVAGQIPQGEVLLSTERLNRVREVAPLDDVIIAEAGVTLHALREAAAGADRLFPLSLASEGSCSVGGLLSTNAGGTGVLRYGTTRELTLGIEAVLPDGSIVHGLKRLRKDNTGYDLRGLMIGAEGTLGVVTAAAFKLFPRPASRAVALLGLERVEDALQLLARAKAETGGAVEAFELMSRSGFDLALRMLKARDPVEGAHPWLLLIEITSPDPDGAAPLLERLLTEALEAGLIQDAAVAQDETQAHAFWALRESQSGAQKGEGAAWKHDVAVPVAQVPTFLREATAAVQRFSPGVRVVAFGHVGDGNIHYDVLRAPGSDDDAHAARRDAGARIVHDIVDGLGGSISAEHGLGAMKSAEALRYKDPATVAAMRAIRGALDPQRIMNPRVLF